LNVRAALPKPKEELAGVLFELANSDRLTLLSQIVARKHKMLGLSKVLNVSVPECSRHLSRLANSGLVRKDSSGLYEATSVGRALLRLLPALETIIQHREYFMTHDLSYLPEEFILRIGALSEAERLSHFSEVLEKIKATIFDAEEYSLLMVDKPILVGKKEGPTYDANRPRARFIFSDTVDQKVLQATKAAFPRSEIALAKDIEIAVGVTEKRAGVILPSSSGRLDFGNGFFGETPLFREWCRDLFEFYWDDSRKVPSQSPFSSLRVT
jgi:predicted transcriptional regulator